MDLLLFVNTCLASRLLSSWLTTVCFSHFPSSTSCFVLPEKDKTRVKTGISVCLSHFIFGFCWKRKQTNKRTGQKKKELERATGTDFEGEREARTQWPHLSSFPVCLSLLIVSPSLPNWGQAEDKLRILFMPFMSRNVWWDQDADSTEEAVWQTSVNHVKEWETSLVSVKLSFLWLSLVLTDNYYGFGHFLPSKTLLFLDPGDEILAGDQSTPLDLFEERKKEIRWWYKWFMPLLSTLFSHSLGLLLDVRQQETFLWDQYQN